YIYPNEILQIQSLKEIRLKNGVYRKTDETTDTYYGGNIVERKIHGGSISMSYNSGYRIKFDNGDEFSGTDRDFIKNPDEFVNFTSVSDALLNNGRLTKSSKVLEFDIYKNGIVTGGRWPLADGGYVEYEDNVLVRVTYPDGRQTVDGAEFAKHYPYNPNLKSTDYVLQNGGIQYNNGNIRQYKDGKLILATLTTVEDIYLFAKEEGYESVSFDLHKGTSIYRVEKESDHLVFKMKNDAKQLNSSEFYIKIQDKCFSYPKSYITIYYNSSGAPVLSSIETCNVSASTEIKYNNYWNPTYDGYMSITWLYKPFVTKDGITYCKTKGLYIIKNEKENLQWSDKILCDLSSTFTQGHNRAFKKVSPAPKKKTYHREGYIENCGYCLGSGNGLQGGYCPFCGGKGWYIEHYW
ncbi:MAG: hypothetical protein K2J96_06710, partial [Bacteroidaceae bacterium]|nr:hypothetical protein [Bacteroidaceae bacterium]